MSEEIQHIIAFIFKRSGKQQLSYSEFYLTISMELNWCAPHIAKEFTDQLITKGYLQKTDENLTPTFSLKTISIPTGFIPSKNVFDASTITQYIAPNQVNLYDQIVERITQHKTQTKDEIYQGIDQYKTTLLITQEIAGFLYAKKLDVPIDDLLKKMTVLDVKENTT